MYIYIYIYIYVCVCVCLIHKNNGIGKLTDKASLTGCTKAKT